MPGSGVGYDPNNILGGAFPWTDLSKWGDYGASIRSALAPLYGPNMPAMVGASTETGMVDPAGQQYQATLARGKADFAGRGLTGSGVNQSLIADALNNLQGTESQASAAGSQATKALRDQLQMKILNQLAQISSGRAQGQAGVQGANIGLQAAQNQSGALKRSIFGDIFGTGAGLVGLGVGTFFGGPGGGLVGSQAGQGLGRLFGAGIG